MLTSSNPSQVLASLQANLANISSAAQAAAAQLTQLKDNLTNAEVAFAALVSNLHTSTEAPPTVDSSTGAAAGSPS